MYTAMPPLNALRAFEAAARHLSMSQAAQELRVTASALSHQICGLEELVNLHGGSTQAQALKGMPLIHDDMLANRPHVPTWIDWFKAAGIDVDVSRGLRFNSPDHALQAAGEGAGVLLSQYVLAYDDLRTG